MFFRRKKDYDAPTRPPEFTYAWRGKPRQGCPAVYLVLQKVPSDSTGQETAMRRGDRTRTLIQRDILCENPPDALRAYYAEVGAIWDEIFPPLGRLPQRFPTHFLEVGLQGDGLPRSPFLQTALALYVPRHDLDYADYCSIEIGAFLQWQFGTWQREDFDGAALDTKPARQWLLQCIFAKWKSLRDG